MLLRDGFGPHRWFECYVAEIGADPVGYVLACRRFEAHTGKRRLWLGDLYVHPHARRQGTARALLGAVARRALALRCDAVIWELWQPNVAAGEFYQRLGAVRHGDLHVMTLSAEALTAVARRFAAQSCRSTALGRPTTKRRK